MPLSNDNRLWDEVGFWRHCEVAEVLIRLGRDPHTNHHIRSAIREASKKVGTGPGQNLKRHARYMSHAAEAVMLRGSSSGLRVDHGVPISVITELVDDLPNPSKSEIGRLVREWTVFAVITQEEHDALRLAKLSQCMPPGWDGKDMLARYRESGIALKENRYRDLCGN